MLSFVFLYFLSSTSGRVLFYISGILFPLYQLLTTMSRPPRYRRLGHGKELVTKEKYRRIPVPERQKEGEINWFHHFYLFFNY